MDSKPVLLSDEQVRSFIVNGMLVLKPEIDKSIHSEINSLLAYSSQNESWHGNNLISRIPLTHKVLRSPIIHGALVSLAGPNYYLHPHRALHRSTPVDEVPDDINAKSNAPKMGQGSTAGSGWHQDAQSPLARARHHLPKFLIGFYFPHDTPRAMGPTRLVPGSYLHSNPTEVEDVFFPDFVEAGTFILVHFDMVHAGYPNQTEQDRYMLKFVFTRTETPSKPSWNHQNTNWIVPENKLVSSDLTPAWVYIWQWLLGSAQTKKTNVVKANRPTSSTSSSQRVLDIYSGKDPENPSEILNRLLQKQGQNKHERVLIRDRNNKPVPRDDTRGFPIRWNERAIVMEEETYQLAAMGKASLDALSSLLASNDPWLQINAAFAIGEINESPKIIMSRLIALLGSMHQQVVRQVLDTLAFKTTHLTEACYEAIKNVIRTENSDWLVPLVQRGWTAQDQIRLNAAFLLLNATNCPNRYPQVEELLADLLLDKNGYAAAVAAEGLIRLGTPTSTQAAVQYLSDRRWDESINSRKAF